jgi:hypothetical protein
MAEARTLLLMLPAAEDANAIQVGLMRIQKAVIEDTISTKKAGLLLYSMQLALTNVGQTTFGKAKDEEMVRETVDEEEAFSNQHSALSERQHQHQNQSLRPFTAKDAEDAKESKQNQHQHQRPFTTEDTEEEKSLPANQKVFTAEDAEEEKGLPRMDADERGLENPINPIEWKPAPDMYRMDTREGMEAYEASFGMKIKPGSSGEQRPMQPVIAPEERAEVHAILG